MFFESLANHADQCQLPRASGQPSPLASDQADATADLDSVPTGAAAGPSPSSPVALSPESASRARVLDELIALVGTGRLATLVPGVDEAASWAALAAWLNARRSEL
jgi:hypothetical protein